MALIRGLEADIYWLSGSTSMTAEAMTDQGDHMHYHVTSSAHRFWVPASVTIDVDGTPASPQPTIQYCGGQCTFTSSQGSSTITADGYWRTVAQCSQGKNWTLTATMDKVETTQFQSSGREWTATFAAGTVSFGRFYPGGGTVASNILTSTPSILGVVLYEDYSAGRRWEFYGYYDGDELSVAADGVLEENVSLDILGMYGINYYAS